MPRELPPRPHLEHLKKQAKELLEAFRRGDPEAHQRFATGLPALGGRSPAEAAEPLALHDAQSVIAREYGFSSWRVLRAELEQRADRRFIETLIAQHIQRPLPGEVVEALQGLQARWSNPTGEQLALVPLPEWLPVLPVRDFLLSPRSIAPLHVMRPFSLAALDAAALTDAGLAVFAQRDPRTEDIAPADLYPVGCQVRLRSRIPQAKGAFVIVEGVRWIALQELTNAGAHLSAKVRSAREPHASTIEDDALATEAAALRARAHEVAKLAFPEPQRAIELIDSIELPDQLCDLVIVNLQCPLADKARYAAECDARERLRIVTALLEDKLAR